MKKQITVLYFARFKEQLSCDREELSLDSTVSTLEDLKNLLGSRGPQWQSIFNDEKVLAAVNQTISPFSQALENGDEVAFFPPVTGG